MGSAIPSRSFKILQAMTTPENAAEMEGSGVEYEQVPPNFYPPYPYPYQYPAPPYFYPPIDPNWHYPYPPPIPFCYYYTDYDSQNGNILPTGGYHMFPPYRAASVPQEIKMRTPDIIITPTLEEKEKQDVTPHTKPEQTKEGNTPETVLDLLSKKLNQLSGRPELEINLSKNDKKYVGEGNKKLVSSPSPVNNNRLTLSEMSISLNDCNDSDEDSISSSSSSDSLTGIRKRRVSSHDSKEGLQAIKSVTDIKVYDYVENLIEPKIEDEEEESSISLEVTPEDELNNIEDSDTDVGEDFTEIDILLPGGLSVISEESELEKSDVACRMRRQSEASAGSTLSDTTTIANEDSINDENDHVDNIGIENLDEQQNFVTVRLPLKLSFSRSSQDENIATVVVGDSEIEDDRSSSQPNINDENGGDVSVTFSLKSNRSSSIESGKKSTSEGAKVTGVSSSDSDVSLSLSLPMQRNKFEEATERLAEEISSSESDTESDEEEEELEIPQDNSAEVKKEDYSVVSNVLSTEADQMKDGTFENTSADLSEWKSEKRIRNFANEDNCDTWDWDSFPSSYEPQPMEKEVCKVEEDKIYNPLEEQGHEEESNLSEQKDQDEGNSETSTEDSSDDEDTEEEVDLEANYKEKEEDNENGNDYKDESETETYDSESEIEEEIQEDLKVEESTKVQNQKPEGKDDKYAKVKQNEDDLDNSESTDSEEVEDQTPTSDFPPGSTETPFNFSFNTDTSNCATSLEEPEEIKVSVRDRIAVFELAATLDSNTQSSKLDPTFSEIAMNNTSQKKKVLSRNSSLQKSESELEEDDSGVTDMSKPISETDTESECFPELKKMTRYQRAATHSRLFKLLQGESSFDETGDEATNAKPSNTFQQRKKVVHNVSITRKNNPDLVKDAETMAQRRERLSLPLKKTNSIDADNLSTSNSPSSPVGSSINTDKIVNELIQSLLLKKKSRFLRNLPMEKLQAAARRVLEEDLDSLENTSLDSTPALTPQENKSEETKSYAEYYETWNAKNLPQPEKDYDILPSKAFRTLQEQNVSGRRKAWAARCPRVLSSKTLNRDLARVTESPEMYRSSSLARQTPDKHIEFIRGRSLSSLEA